MISSSENRLGKHRKSVAALERHTGGEAPVEETHRYTGLASVDEAP